jgi:hypothetical protein
MMSSPDRGAGPQITQDVLYNNGGTIIAGTMYAVNANGTVNLVFFGTATPATSATGVLYDPNLGIGKWSYPPFQ